MASLVSQLQAGLVGLSRVMKVSPADEGWSEGDLLWLDCPGRDDIKHGGQTAHQAEQTGQAYHQPHYQTHH